MTTETKKLGWGYSTLEYEGSQAAWGARLILTRTGGDLLYDRQSLIGESEEAKRQLTDRLNTVKPWHEPLGNLIREGHVRATESNEVVVYEDDLIRVIGNSNGSYGYFYMTGWLK